MPNIYKVAVAIFGVLVVAGVATYLWLRPSAPGEATLEPIPVTKPTRVQAPTPTLAERLSGRLKTVTLATSDAAVRTLTGELSSDPELAKWIMNEDLVRRFVASVDNIADGRSPRKHLEFMRPTTPFRAVNKRGALYINPSSYHRYDLAAQVFASLDTKGTVALYRELEPLLDEAYREISPPGWSFEPRLMQAIDELLAVPVPTREVQLDEKTVATFEYSDDTLASLSDAQRHLLRMGPDNLRRVQAKLRELRDALESGP